MLINIDSEKRTVSFDDKTIQYADLYQAFVEVLRVEGGAYFEDLPTEFN